MTVEKQALTSDQPEVFKVLYPFQDLLDIVAVVKIVNRVGIGKDMMLPVQNAGWLEQAVRTQLLSDSIN